MADEQPVGQRMLRPDGTPVYVSPEEAQAAFQAGQLGFDPKDQVIIPGDNGELHTVSGEQAASLLSQNPFQRLGDYQSFARQEEKKAYDTLPDTAAAAAIGVGNALTVGAGRGMAVDFAGSLFGDEAQRKTRDYLRAQEEYHPIAGGIGEGVGMIAPLLLSGGTSAGVQGASRGLLGTAGRALSAPTRALGLIGEGAELAIGAGTKVVGLAEGGLAARALGAAGRGAAEMSLYGVGDAYSKSRLEDKELTGEQLLAAAGHHALMGATLGGGLVVGGAALGKTLQGIGKGAAAVEAKATELAERFGTRVPSLSAIEQEQVIKALAGSNGSKLVREIGEWSPELQSRLVAQVQQDVPRVLGKDSLATVSRAELAAGMKEVRKEAGKAYEAAIKDMDAAVAKHAKPSHLEGQTAAELRPSLDAVVEKARGDILTTLYEKLPLDKGPAREIEKTIKALERKSADSPLGVSFEEMNRTSQALSAKIVDNPQALAALTMEARAVNDARIALKKTVEAEFERAGSTLAEREGGPEFAARWADAKANYKAARNGELLAKQGATAEAKNNSFGLGAMLSGNAGAGAGATVGTALAGPAGGLVGSALGGAVGAVGGNLVKRYGNQVAATLAGRVAEGGLLHAVDRTLTETIGANVTQLVKGISSRAPKATQVAELANRVSESNKRSAQAEYDRRREALVRFAGNPQGVMNRTLSNAPADVRAAATAAVVKGADYLQSIAPKPLATGSPLQPKADTGQVDPAQRDRWLRAARAVDDPLSVITDARAGTLTPDAVAAVKAVYPRIYGQIQGQIMNELRESGKPLSYTQQQQLSILLGVPAGASLSPEYISAVQAPPTKATPLKTSKIEVAQSPDLLGSQQIQEKSQS